jgi:superfamily II DNA or RNA helicase
MNVTQRLAAYLKLKPHSPTLDIYLALRKQGGTCSKRELNRALYQDEGRCFERTDEEGPRWRPRGMSTRVAERALAQREAARNEPPKFDASKRVPVPKGVKYPRTIIRTDLDVRTKKLFLWQREALNAWRGKRRLGVIEAVTGTGKTMVGIVAAAEELQYGGKVLVLVPTIELQNQWKKKFEEHLPGTDVGRLGDGKRDGFGKFDILVSVVNSARAAKLRPPKGRGLLIADECHRYGSRFNNKALSPHFPRRLGLTATLKRDDYGDIEWLKPYFWHEVFRVDYRRAKHEHIIAPFRIGLIGVRLPRAQFAEYERLSRQVFKYRNELVRDHGVPENPFGEFMRHVVVLKKRSYSSREGRAAQLFLKAFLARQKLLAEAKVKYDALRRLAPAVHAATRSIVFTQTKAAALSAARVLGAQGLRVGVIHSGVSRKDRRDILEMFREGDHQVIVAPKVLDEGIDVPEADLGIIVTASRSKRQMIQRMGRVIRPKQNGDHARIAVLFVEQTSEDPANGAHEAFLEELRDVAEGERTFSAATGAAAITRYLKP